MRSNFPTYITHYKGNTDRKRLMEKILNKEDFSDVTWITDFDRENITYSMYVESFQADPLEHQRRQIDSNEFFPHYPLQPEIVSLCLKHKEALRLIGYGDAPYGLILEDDAILCEGFIEKFYKHFQQLPVWDVAFIGQGGNKRIPENKLVDGQAWYLKEHPADRCADSVVITKEAAKRIYDNMVHYKICCAADAELAFWMKALNLKVYWLEPPIVTQGSQIGLFKSIQPPRSAFVNKSMPVRGDLPDLLQQVEIEIYDER